MNNYTIKYGDTLSGIALKNGTTVQALMSANPTIKDANKIIAGSSLTLPTVPNNIQTTTQQRNTDTKTQADYNNILTSKGLNNVTSTPAPTNTPNTGTQTPTNTNNGTTQTNTNGTQTNGNATPSNLTGVIDSAYLSGVTDPAEILKQSGGTLDLDTINKRLATLNADPVFSANAKVMSGFQSSLKALDDQKLQLDNQFATLKQNMEAENKSAVDSIQANFALRRDQLKRSYESLMGSREKMGYQTDAFRYTPAQMGGLITNDEQNYITNLAELDAKEKELLLQASSAKAKGDWDFLQKSVDAYNKINDDRKSILGEMLKVSVENNKKITADNKIAETAKAMTGTKAQQTADSVAESIAKEMSGLSGDAYTKKLTEYATQYKIDPKVLDSSVINAQNALKKAGLDIANKNKTLNKTSNPKSNTKKVTVDQAIGKAVTDFKKKMQAKGWKGVNPDDYDAWYNYIIQTYGYSGVTKLQKALDDEGLIIDK